MPRISQNNGVAITGMGIISAIGETVLENLESLLKSESGITELSLIDTIHSENIKVGEIKISNHALAKKLELPQNHNYTRTALLGAMAAKEAFESARIKDADNFKTGLINASTVGGMDKTELHFKEFTSKPETQKYISSHIIGDSTQKIADELNITGFTTSISTACSSAANAIMLGARMIKAGKLDRVVVGGVDSLSKFTINGFKTLMILSDENCTPFDANRKGLNLGEAAAFLVLESNEIVAKENRKVLAYVSGYGNANDAFHQTASSENGEGAFLAMENALQVSGLKPQEIDYINAHGTATQNNDLSESVALKRVFGTNLPPFSSTKGFTGHTLAAAGSVEAVFSILALQENVIFPNLGFEKAMPETGLIPETKLQKKELKHILSNSFGFGGNCTSLIFSKG